MDPFRKRQILAAEERAALMAALVAKGFYVYPMTTDEPVGQDPPVIEPLDAAQQAPRARN